MNLFSLISLFSSFACFAKGYPLPVKATYLKYGGRPQSQPTRLWAHADAVPPAGAGGGVPPLDPAKSQRQVKT